MGLLRLKRLTGACPVLDDQTGFIHHPAGFPLECKRVWFRWRRRREPESNDIGLLFESDRYIPPGATLEITIPLRAESPCFNGRVVLVRHAGDHFEIGIWFPLRADACRMRIVEQICHIEAYLQQKKYFDGPYALNRERVAEEWISKYAGTVPTL